MFITLVSWRSMAVAVAALTVVACASAPPVAAPQAPVDSAIVGGVIVAESGLDGGSATYSINIDVPPARNHAGPDIKVKYSSQTGNDLLGMGWYLNTPGRIYRCPATLAMDGYSAGVSYAKTDRLCLNGDHLVLTSGVYGRSGSTYQEEVADGSETSLVGDLDNASSYFVVTYGDGNKTFYKTAFEADGRHAPLYWYASRYLDTQGNTIDYSYDRSIPGEILVSDIRYTGREINGTETRGTRFVRFSYEVRPDISSNFLAGGETRQTRRLAAITVGINADKSALSSRKTREYAFSYKQSRTTGRSLLSEIHECIIGDDGVKHCLPPTKFSWANESLKFKDPVKYALPDLGKSLQPLQLLDATSIMRLPYIVSGDFDGDGRRELLYYRPGVGAHLYFVNPDGTLRKDVDVSKFFQSSPEFMFHSSTVDIDNDGASDLPGNSNGHLAFASWDGMGMGKPVVTDIPYADEMAFAYTSGGRQADVIQAERIKPGSSSYGLFLYRNLDSRPGVLRFSPRQLIYALKNRGAGAEAPHERFYVAGDIDGNGLSDIVIHSGEHIDYVIFSRQDSDGSLHFDVRTPAAIGLAARSLDNETYFADINGDGLFDVVYSEGQADGPKTWRYQLNEGGHFKPPVNTGVDDERSKEAAIRSTLVTDIDNDGEDEILYPDKMVVPYCMGFIRKVNQHNSIDEYHCADDSAGLNNPADDMSIYKFAILKFKESANGRMIPVVNHDSNIIAQANLVASDDLQGDGLTDVISAFSPWYADGRFRDGAGKYSSCPPVYGCGLHVASNISAGHKDGVNGAPDLMTGAIDGLGEKTFWDYYPLSTTKPGFYSVKPVGKPGRYIDKERYYLTSSMYLVGAYGSSSGVGDGYYAYSYQYGDEVFDNAGRGLIGFRYDIEHDLSEKYRQISIFDQRFPLDGRLLAQWKVKETTVDDGLENGVPPPDHAYYLADSWDCEAPKDRVELGGLKCIDSGGPTFSYRLRHKTAHVWDSTLKEMTDVDATYDYDQDANETQRTTKTASSKKIETVEISTRYAPRNSHDWTSGRVIEQKTIKIIDPVPGVKDAPAKSRTDEDDTFEYDSRGWTYRNIERGPNPYVETHVFSYQEDPTADDYGQLKTLTITRSSKVGEPVDYLRTVRISYDEGGYFPVSFSSLSMDPDTIVYDPVTGNVLHEVKDGVTEIYKYDTLGRPIHYERTEKGKDPFTWSVEYYPCYAKECIEDAVYRAMELINNKLMVTTYYDKRGKKINHPKESLLKGD